MTGLTALPDRVLDFELPAGLEASTPAEERGTGRDDVRLLVSHLASGLTRHHHFRQLPQLLTAGDVLVVNNSGTLPAAVDSAHSATPGTPAGASDLTVHFSTEQDDGGWVVELRAGNERYTGGGVGDVIELPGAARLTLRARYSPDRLWLAEVDVCDVHAYLHAHGRPIRYGYVRQPRPLAAYQTVFATRPGSAEMPSAARPFTQELVTRLVSEGIVITSITLHTGVASPEAHEKPYPEWFEVPEATARVVAQARAAGNRVIAVGTTAVRALESVTDRYGRITAASGWTDLVVTPDRGVRAVDGLLTGLHEPRASHLLMLQAIAGLHVLRRTYAEALDRRYLWHEFGDVNLLL